MNAADRAMRRHEITAALGVRPGDTWRTDHHVIVCGAAPSPLDPPAACDGVLLLDPPHEHPDMYAVAGRWASIIALTDCRYVGPVIDALGPPRWLFVWDCVGSVYRRGQPRRNAKLALWYGDSPYNELGYTYEKGQHPRWPRGLFLADVYRQSLATLHAGELHRYAKPVEWLACLIGNTSPPGAMVVDPYMGGGAALEAAHLLGRPYFGWDTDPESVAVALSRPTLAALDWRRS